MFDRGSWNRTQRRYGTPQRRSTIGRALALSVPTMVIVAALVILTSAYTQGTTVTLAPSATRSRRPVRDDRSSRAAAACAADNGTARAQDHRYRAAGSRALARASPYAFIPRRVYGEHWLAKFARRHGGAGALTVRARRSTWRIPLS